ncbi:shikimate dehydrogenase [Arsenicicoccus dermatophilus]|uniref:shikimate dehydrogenase n=1 Tax=Arsenicicoccus dermatophilus TaxID=1076331 RepID=UPI003917013E
MLSDGTRGVGGPGTGGSDAGDLDADEIRHAAVVGSPIGHSLSPVMHRAAYARLGLDDWSYDRLEVAEGGLAAFVAGLDPSWRGLSITMPLKEEALALAAGADPVARVAGAANTLVRAGDGWSAYNTDVHGIRAALGDHGIDGVGRVAVLGAGATARSVLLAAAELGAREVVVLVRYGVRPQTEQLARTLGLGWATASLDAADVTQVVPGVDLVVNTLPGEAGDAVAPVVAAVAARFAQVPGGRVPPLLEVVYEGWPTALARAFAGAGAPVVSGLEMLAHQAARQVTLMTGREVPARVLLDAARAAPA